MCVFLFHASSDICTFVLKTITCKLTLSYLFRLYNAKVFHFLENYQVWWWWGIVMIHMSILIFAYQSLCLFEWVVMSAWKFEYCLSVRLRQVLCKGSRSFLRFASKFLTVTSGLITQILSTILSSTNTNTFCSKWTDKHENSGQIRPHPGGGGEIDKDL